MKSVLVSTDFVKDNEGNFRALEINTDTAINFGLSNNLTIDNFETQLNGFFEYELLNNFMIENNLTKIVLIESIRTSNYIFFEVFCEKYNFLFENIKIGVDEFGIPNIEDNDSHLIIRVAYDPYAIIDDLYCADMFEYHKLIVSESFAPNIVFESSLNLNTIIDYSSSINENWPNYIIKPRTPHYPKYEYPKLLNITSSDGLDYHKTTLEENNFISEYYINTSSLLDVNGRQSYYRNLSLVYGTELEVLELSNYREFLRVSTENDILSYNSEIEEDGVLNSLYATKFVPMDRLIREGYYHFDDNDKALLPDNSLISLNQIETGSELKSIHINNTSTVKNPKEFQISDFNDFTLTSSFVETINEKNHEQLFVNIIASSSEYGTFEWYDGATNLYLTDINDQTSVKFKPGFELSVGDTIYIFDISINEHRKLLITDLYFDLKEIDVYSLDLEPQDLLFIQITNDIHTTDLSTLFLIQHNGNCNPAYCGPTGGRTCSYFTCENCAKGALNCVNCGGAATPFCT